LLELAVVLGAFEPDAADAALEAGGSVGLAGLTLEAGFIALIPAPLGTSEPDGPGAEPPTGPALAPEPPAPAPMPPAPLAPCANAFEVNIARLSDSAAPRTIVDKFFFIAVSLETSNYQSIADSWIWILTVFKDLPGGATGRIASYCGDDLRIEGDT
jgi:hypothetical protein